MTQKKGSPIWISLFLKALLIMIIPMYIYGTDFLQLVILPPTGFLYTPVNYFLDYFARFVFSFNFLGQMLRNLVIGLVIAFPGMFFSYKLSQAPVNRSYWKRGLGAAIVTYILATAIILTLWINMYNPIEFMYDETLWMLYERLNIYPTLVFSVFIILPLVQRQAISIASPRFLHYQSMTDIESNPNLSLSREKFLSGILWFFLCFAPFTIAYTPYSIWGGIPFLSLMMRYSFGSYIPLPIEDILHLQIAIGVNSFGLIPFLALMNVFQFMFVRDIYRYLRKSITRLRLIGIALFSTIGPFFISLGIVPINPFYIFGTLIPIPLVQGVGFLVVRWHHPIADQLDRVWDADEHRMWWEPERERAKERPRMTTPEKPQRHRDGEIITVPVHYLFLSRLRSIHRRKS